MESSFVWPRRERGYLLAVRAVIIYQGLWSSVSDDKTVDSKTPSMIKAIEAAQQDNFDDAEKYLLEAQEYVNDVVCTFSYSPCLI